MGDTQADRPQDGTAIPEPSRQLMARLDRIPEWSLPPWCLAIISLGIVFTFFDIFDFNVAFVQTCREIVPGCTPQTAIHWFPWPTSMYLLGFFVGGIFLSPLADRFGRRDLLLITMFITGVGALYSALSGDYANFVASRFLTGVGVGADVAIVNTYMAEVAPKSARARYTSMIYVMAGLGASAGIWIALLLTTPAAAWPTGLPFAIGGHNPSGWRWLYGIGALLAAISIALRFRLPESPRWFLQKGRVAEATALTEAMEHRASRRAPLEAPNPASIPQRWPDTRRGPYLEILRNPLYLRRAILFFFIWFAAYTTTYGFGTGMTSVLTSLSYTPHEAGMIAAVGSFGFFTASLVMFYLAETLDRRLWMIVSTVLLFIGVAVMSAAGASVGIAFVGSFLIFAGFNLYVGPLHAMTAENFPTRARATGSALTVTLGAAAGGVGISAIVPLIPHLSVFWALSLISSFMIVASILALFSVRTRNRVFEQLAP